MEKNDQQEFVTLPTYNQIFNWTRDIYSLGPIRLPRKVPAKAAGITLAVFVISFLFPIKLWIKISVAIAIGYASHKLKMDGRSPISGVKAYLLHYIEVYVKRRQVLNRYQAISTVKKINSKLSITVGRRE